MSEYRHPLYFSGGYQVVALVSGREYDPARVVGYELLTLSGTVVRQEASLDSARAWMDRLAREEAGIPRPAPERREAERPRAPAKRAVKRKGTRGLLRRLLRR